MKNAIITSVCRNRPMTDINAGVLENIVVTAQKREENAQNLPVAITVISVAALTDSGIKNIQDLANSMPNVQNPSDSSGELAGADRGLFEDLAP